MCSYTIIYGNLRKLIRSGTLGILSLGDRRYARDYETGQRKRISWSIWQNKQKTSKYATTLTASEFKHRKKCIIITLLREGVLFIVIYLCNFSGILLGGKLPTVQVCGQAITFFWPKHSNNLSNAQNRKCVSCKPERHPAICWEIYWECVVI